MEDKAFQTKRLKEWNSNDISNWLASIGMKAYITTFKNELITGRHLCKFDEDDLRTKCKITARPIRKILFKRLKHVQGRWKQSGDDESDEEKTIPVKKEPHIPSVEEPAPVEESPVEETEQPEEDSDVLVQDENREMTPEEATFKIQSLYRCWKGHRIVIRMIQEQYRKRYSIETGRYVYVYVGGRMRKSGTTTTTTTTTTVLSPLAPDKPLAMKPIHLGPKIDLPIEFTEELAIMRIQLFARYCYIIKQVRRMVRSQWERVLDPVSGKYFYFHQASGIKIWNKPKLLGVERWDPMDMEQWTVEDVQFHFRKMKMGSKQITVLNEVVHQYQIDGNILLIFNETDLSLLGIPLPQRKRLIQEIESVQRNISFDPEIPRRKRDRFRHNYKILHAAITIQRNFRRYSSETKFVKVLDSLKNSKQKYHLQHQRTELSIGDNHFSNLWWSNFPLQTVCVYFYHLSQSGDNGIIKSLLQTDDSFTLHYDNVVL